MDSLSARAGALPQSDEDVAAAAAEANFFALVSHQYWGIWALIQVLMVLAQCSSSSLVVHDTSWIALTCLIRRSDGKASDQL